MTVPKTITLVVTKDSGNGGYPGHADCKINMQGDISETEIITVTPSDDIIKLNQGLKDAKSATVKLDSNITIPDTVITIYSFSNCNSLTSFV